MECATKIFKTFICHLDLWRSIRVSVTALCTCQEQRRDLFLSNLSLRCTLQSTRGTRVRLMFHSIEVRNLELAAVVCQFGWKKSVHYSWWNVACSLSDFYCLEWDCVEWSVCIWYSLRRVMLAVPLKPEWAPPLPGYISLQMLSGSLAC